MYKELIDKLEREQVLAKQEYLTLIENRSKCADYLAERARAVREKHYGKGVYIRGLIEFSSYCKNDCLYCGIRRSNKNAQRYRLTPEEIVECAERGYDLGFRTFVLQGGEDAYFTDDILCETVKKIKSEFPDCAITLSLGERSYESLKRLKEAGADRYLLRHETCDSEHYKKLHPSEMSFENRQECIRALKQLGYQVGVGFMVGSPFQTASNLADEMLYLKSIEPQMVGIGPFLSHKDTPFNDFENGSAELTLFLLSLIRLTLPRVLLPSTTALGTADALGREKGFLAGANVTMPNLTPARVRKKYMLYDNKICTGEEAAQCIECLKRRVSSTGYEIVTSRGDYKNEV